MNENKSEQFSEGYIAGQSDGYTETIRLCCEYLSGCGYLEAAESLKRQFVVE